MNNEDRPRALVVDDEQAIRDLVSLALKYEGFEVATASTGGETLALVDSFRPDLIVLDVMLPDLTGFRVAERLRSARHETPILFLTARDTLDDKVRGLTVGGDDYLTKPFAVVELVARARALIRRSTRRVPARLVLADLELDDDSHEVFRAGQLVDLTATEYRLLHFLLANARTVISRDRILDHVWSYDFNGDPSILETYISYLRRKIDFVEPKLIHTVRGVGYVMRVPRPSPGDPDS